MYVFDEDIIGKCHNCNNEFICDSNSMELNETGGMFSLTSFPLSCPTCESRLILTYSLNVDNDFDYIRMQYSYNSIGFDILEDLSIIENPIHISKIGRVDNETYKRIINLMQDITNNPSLMSNASRRGFEIIVAELVRRKGFSVHLTKQTRDGGKDIIAIKNEHGIPFKMFVECKHPDVGNAIGVDIVRSLYGVHNTKNGPNKSILVTSSYFSPDAKKFVKNETNSEWQLGLHDYTHVIDWLNNRKN